MKNLTKNLEESFPVYLIHPDVAMFYYISTFGLSVLILLFSLKSLGAFITAFFVFPLAGMGMGYLLFEIFDEYGEKIGPFDNNKLLKKLSVRFLITSVVTRIIVDSIIFLPTYNGWFVLTYFIIYFVVTLFAIRTNRRTLIFISCFWFVLHTIMIIDHKLPFYGILLNISSWLPLLYFWEVKINILSWPNALSLSQIHNLVRNEDSINRSREIEHRKKYENDQNVNGASTVSSIGLSLMISHALDMFIPGLSLFIKPLVKSMLIGSHEIYRDTALNDKLKNDYDFLSERITASACALFASMLYNFYLLLILVLSSV